MDSKQALALSAKIAELQSLMVAYATDGRTSDQPSAYRELYGDVTLGLGKVCKTSFIRADGRIGMAAVS